MALTQIQIIQSLGEPMSWFERELNWGVPPTKLRHLIGHIGVLYAALITNGQMTTEVNQKGYDLVSGLGERISVKTTAVMGGAGIVSFNINTMDQVDRVIILRINTEEMQIETLLDSSVDEARAILGSPNAAGKVSINQSKLVRKPKDQSEIHVIRSANFEDFTMQELAAGAIEILRSGEVVSVVKPVLRRIASKLGLSIQNISGNPLNTRQLGIMIIRELQSNA